MIILRRSAISVSWGMRRDSILFQSLFLLGELRLTLRNELLVSGKVEKTRDTEYGPSHTVLSGFTGPNGRHATVVSCWLIEDREGVSVPKLTTTWAQPHRDKESGR